MSYSVYENGQKDVTVPSGSKLAIYSLGAVKLYKNVGYPNFPDSWDLEKTTTEGETYTTAAMSAETVYRIDAGPAIVSYSVGVVPSVGGPVLFKQSAAVAKADGAETVTAAQLINGLVVFTVTTGRTLTTPTGAAITAACPADVAVGDSFLFHLITIGAGADDIATLTAGDGAVTFVGDVTCGPSGSTFNDHATWLFRCSGAGTWVGYRIG